MGGNKRLSNLSLLPLLNNPSIIFALHSSCISEGRKNEAKMTMLIQNHSGIQKFSRSLCQFAAPTRSIRNMRSQVLLDWTLLNKNWGYSRLPQILFIIFIELTLYRIKPEDWFTVSMVEAYEAGLPRHSFQRSVQLVELLRDKYPSLDLQRMSILRGKFGQQRKLEQAVSSLFPVQSKS